MQVSPDALAVLDRAACTGNALVLTGQLDRKLYEQTAQVLDAAGGKWNRKAKAHLFEGDAAAAVEPILLTGTVTSTKQEFGQFYTPADLAARVVAEARIGRGMTVLEPSAGRGALAAPALLAGAVVDCVEIDPRSVHLLASTPYNAVVEGDFLGIDPDPCYDRIVMNPPFARRADIRHVTHAARFLKPGGRLVAIMSAGITFLNNREAADLRLLLSERGATVERLPERSFAAAGTDVNAVLVAIDAPGGPSC